MKKPILSILFIFCLSFQASAWNPMVVVSGSSCLTVDDDFTGSNDDPPNTTLWAETDATNLMDIQSNKLNYDSGDVTAASNPNINSVTKWSFPANTNFDVQIDFDVTTLDDPDSGINNCPRFELRNAANDIKSYIIRGFVSGGDNGYQSDGTATAFGSYAQADASGKIRFVMSGCPGSCVLKGYIWDGSQWEWNDNTAGYTFSEDFSAGPIYVKIQWIKVESAGNTQVTGNVDNFTVNAGCPE